MPQYAIKVYELESNLYNLRRSSIDGLLLEQVAEKQGMSIDAFYPIQLYSQVRVTESDINVKIRFKNRIPKEWRDADIRTYLRSEKARVKQQQYLQDFMNEKRIQITLKLQNSNLFVLWIIPLDLAS